MSDAKKPGRYWLIVQAVRSPEKWKKLPNSIWTDDRVLKQEYTEDEWKEQVDEMLGWTVLNWQISALSVWNMVRSVKKKGAALGILPDTLSRFVKMFVTKYAFLIDLTSRSFETATEIGTKVVSPMTKLYQEQSKYGYTLPSNWKETIRQDCRLISPEEQTQSVQQTQCDLDKAQADLEVFNQEAKKKKEILYKLLDKLEKEGAVYESEVEKCDRARTDARILEAVHIWLLRVE